MKYPIYTFTPDSPHLPQELWKIPQPPKKIFVQGSPQALEIFTRLPQQGLAVVGTRNPQNRSAIQIQEVILKLRNNPIIILSGLARGVDAIAHRTALMAGLPTVAVLGAGLHIPYPRENEELRAAILKANGLLVSEFEPTMPAMGHQFLLRNRIIAGWSQATWVVEAANRSGALNTARWARDQNRTCLATPCYPGDPALGGNQMLIDRDHAIPLWDYHSLGSVWIELAAQIDPQFDPQLGLKIESVGREKSLILHLKALTYQQNGAQIPELLEWAMGSQGWKAGEFFNVLEGAMARNRIQSRNGTLVSP